MSPVTPTTLVKSLRIPLIAAPMTGVSSLELAVAVADAGIGASFPSHNAPTSAELDRWLGELEGRAGPALPNLVVHRTNNRLPDDLEVVVRRKAPAVITSVGSPAKVVGPLHDAGVLVLSDVASLHHADRAITAGVDGLILLSAGAGGQTGWANPLVFVRALRARWDGLLVLAGGVLDGASMLAALVAGYDLVYMGTRFIATTESAASPEYKQAVIAASMDDVVLTDAYTGIPSSMIHSVKSGPRRTASGELYDANVITAPRPNDGSQTPFSAGQSVSGVKEIVGAGALVGQVESELREAQRRLGLRQPFGE
jgi:nitronate monooxygenase